MREYDPWLFAVVVMQFFFGCTAGFIMGRKTPVAEATPVVAAEIAPITTGDRVVHRLNSYHEAIILSVGPNNNCTTAETNDGGKTIHYRQSDLLVWEKEK